LALYYFYNIIDINLLFLGLKLPGFFFGTGLFIFLPVNKICYFNTTKNAAVIYSLRHFNVNLNVG